MEMKNIYKKIKYIKIVHQLLLEIKLLKTYIYTYGIIIKNFLFKKIIYAVKNHVH